MALSFSFLYRYTLVYFNLYSLPVLSPASSAIFTRTKFYHSALNASWDRVGSKGHTRPDLQVCVFVEDPSNLENHPRPGITSLKFDRRPEFVHNHGNLNWQPGQGEHLSEKKPRDSWSLWKSCRGPSQEEEFVDFTFISHALHKVGHHARVARLLNCWKKAIKVSVPCSLPLVEDTANMWKKVFCSDVSKIKLNDLCRKITSARHLEHMSSNIKHGGTIMLW